MDKFSHEFDFSFSSENSSDLEEHLNYNYMLCIVSQI